MREFIGQCHCGDISLVYRTVFEPDQVPARACDCAYCTAHGAWWSSDPNGSLEIHADSLSRYRFATATADFLFCTRCGTLVAAVCDIDGQTCAVVNLAAIDKAAGFTRDKATLSHLGDELPEDRLARRRRNWTPNVHLRVNQ